MAGPFVRDTNAPSLTAGVTLNAAGTTTGTAVEVNKPGEVVVEVATGTVGSTGNTATMTVVLEASDDSTFATGKVKVGAFAAISGTDASQSNKRYRLKTEIRHRYVRPIVTLGGTAPVYTGTTIKVNTDHYRENLATDTAGT